MGYGRQRPANAQRLVWTEKAVNANLPGLLQKLLMILQCADGESNSNLAIVLRGPSIDTNIRAGLAKVGDDLLFDLAIMSMPNRGSYYSASEYTHVDNGNTRLDHMISGEANLRCKATNTAHRILMYGYRRRRVRQVKGFLSYDDKALASILTKACTEVLKSHPDGILTLTKEFNVNTLKQLPLPMLKQIMDYMDIPRMDRYGHNSGRYFELLQHLRTSKAELPERAAEYGKAALEYFIKENSEAALYLKTIANPLPVEQSN